MAEETKKSVKKRKFNYLSYIISITMLLLMLGLLGLILIQSKNLIKSIKEKMVVQVFLTENLAKTDIDALMNKINATGNINSMFYVSKEQAAADFSEEVGQDFVTFLGYNPLMASLNITLKAAYTDNHNIIEFENQIKRLNGVADISYQKNIFNQLADNIKKISFVLHALAIIFSVIAVILINNTIRLHIYAQRFIIKSMQLVGATHWFIIKPFVVKSIINALAGSVLAIVLLNSILLVLPDYIPEIALLYNVKEISALFLALILCGLTLSVASSFIITNKYLNTRIEDLY